MTPSERERRLEAAWHAYWEAGPSFTAAGDKHAMRAALDAADEAVPVVSEADAVDRAEDAFDHGKAAYRTNVEQAEQRAEHAEATARDLYTALEDFLNGKYEHDGEYQHLHDVLARHESFLKRGRA